MNKLRRKFIGGLGLGTAAFMLRKAAILSAEQGHNGHVPQAVIDEFHLRPLADTKGYGIPAERIWCIGEDGKAYKLSDVLHTLFDMQQ